MQIKPASVGGVKIFRLPNSSSYDRRDLLRNSRTEFDTSRFETLILNTDTYLKNGGRLDILTARDAPRLGIIPQSDLVGPPGAISIIRDPQFNWFRNPDSQYGIALFKTREDQVVIGEVAWYPVAKELVARYGAIANRVEIDSPPSPAAAGFDSEVMTRLAMAFDRDRLRRAAALAAYDLKQPVEDDRLLKSEAAHMVPPKPR